MRIDLQKKGCAIEKPRARDALSLLAEAYDNEKRYDDLVAVRRRILDIAPNDPEAIRDLAWGYFVSRNFTAALDTYKLAGVKNPSAWEGRHTVFLIYLRLGDQSAALQELEAVEKILGKPYPYFREKLTALAALEVWRKAALAKPQDAMSQYGLATVYATLDRQEEAAEALRQAIRIEPKFAEAHYELGRALREQGDEEGALRAFSEAVRLDPGYRDAYQSIAAMHSNEGRRREAIAAYSQMVRIDPADSHTHYILAQLFLEEGDLASARARLPLVARSSPHEARELEAMIAKYSALKPLLDTATRARTNAAAWYKLGLAYEEMFYYDAAIAAFRRAAELSPANLDPHARMAVCFAWKLDHCAAAEEYDFIRSKNLKRAADLLPELKEASTGGSGSAESGG